MIKAVIISDYGVSTVALTSEDNVFDLPERIRPLCCHAATDVQVQFPRVRCHLANVRMFDGRPIYAALGWIVREVGMGRPLGPRNWLTSDNYERFTKVLRDADADNAAAISFMLQSEIPVFCRELDRKAWSVERLGCTVERRLHMIVTYSRVEAVRQRIRASQGQMS